MADVTCWRYYLPSQKGEGFAEIVLCSSGFFGAVSDYGNYSFAWRHFGEGDFRAFVAGLGWDYLAGKLGPCSGHQDQADYERTVKVIREHILEHRREGYYSKDMARAEWEAVELLDGEATEVGIHEWMEATRIEDACELISYGPSVHLRAFCRQTMPRLAELLRAELEAERAAAGTEVANAL